jgi:hypothetical protein
MDKFDVMLQKNGWITNRVFNSLESLNEFLLENKVIVLNIDIKRSV